MAHGPIDGCQICGGQDLLSALFLGFLPPVNSMRPLGAPADSEPWHPAELLVCRRCHLAQLGYVVDPEILFPPEYPYTSGSTRILRENFAELQREAAALVGLAADDLVVDIGSNDGTLLANFQEAGNRVLGIEPTRTGDLARERGIETTTAFFGAETAARARDDHGPAKLVTAANVFAHIPDVHAIVDAIGSLLADDGVFVSESGYFREIVESLQYDTIYHEHLRYYTLTSLHALLEPHGFRIFHAKRIATHGGSIRVYASRSETYAVQSTVDSLLAEERAAGLADESWVGGFRNRVTRSKLSLYDLLADLKADGGRIYGIGAPSRASTLVNYIGLDDGIVECVLEIAGSKKIDKYMPGTAIPVLEESKLYDDQPEYALLLSWHIADELCDNLRRKGYEGRFIVPLPEPHVLTRSPR
jgi:SAM-dependent methyltransferase